MGCDRTSPQRPSSPAPLNGPSISDDPLHNRGISPPSSSTERTPLINPNASGLSGPLHSRLTNLSRTSNDSQSQSNSLAQRCQSPAILTNSFPRRDDSIPPINSNILSRQDEYLPTRPLRESLHWSDTLPYYLPFLSWIKEYSLSYFLGDLTGGMTLVFFQLPLSLSFATTLAKVPVVSGLYSLAVAPLVYLIFGSVPQMIVGPESAISLIVGQAVEPLLHHAKRKNLDPLEYVAAMLFISGATLLGFGLGRFGYLDNVLSASLLKGFISGVGIVMVINASVVTLGLLQLQRDVMEDPSLPDIHSPFDKICFLWHHASKFDPLTAKLSALGFFAIILARYSKRYCSSHDRYKRLGQYLVFVPEILLVLVVLTLFCKAHRWDQNGLEIIGPVKNHGSFHFYNPLLPSKFPLLRQFGTSGFLCAMLGFFESTTASKSLGSSYDLPILSNRELVALGLINLTTLLFGALPAFGGYGRSKINAIFAKTTVLGAIMGLVTLITIRWFLDCLYFVPICMLSVITAVIGLLLLEEAPYELYFHWKTSGHNELVTFLVTVTFTIFFSMEAGIAMGLIYSLLRVIHHLAGLRIQILGRYPGTNKFRNTDRRASDAEKLSGFLADNHDTFLDTVVLQEIEGCLIIKIPEPLTFCNSEDLRNRLQRVEMYGSTKAHPAQKRARDKSLTKYMIFDLNGMVAIDSSAAHILVELLRGYQRRGIKFFFVRVSSEPALRARLENSGIVKLLIGDLQSIYDEILLGELLLGELSHREAGRSSPSKLKAEHTITRYIESWKQPYFLHISDALSVIDMYESRTVEV